MMEVIKHASLFTGIGGSEIAGDWLGWDHVFMSEINPFAGTVLEYQYPHTEILGDVKKQKFDRFRGSVHCLSGGFPCQPYSIAGDRRGDEDPRALWSEMFRAVREISPIYVVGENVLGLLTMSDGMVFESICLDLESEGYLVQPFVLPAIGIGADHNRGRVFIVAYNYERHRELETHQLQTGRTGARPGDPETTEPNDKADASNLRQQRRDKPDGGGARPGHPVPLSREYRPFRVSDRDTVSPICGPNDGIPRDMDRIAVPTKKGQRLLSAEQSFGRWRSQSIKAYGNAIVPHVIYQVFAVIDSHLKTGPTWEE